MADSWHTFGGRLRWAIEQQPPHGKRRGLRLFWSRMKRAAPGVAGTSLTAIQGYLRDATEPSLAFVKAAARLLAVRAPWLAWGIGAPTEEEEVGRRESSEAELFRISTAVYEALGVPTRVPPGTRTLDFPGGAPTEARRFVGPALWAPVVRQTVLRLYQLRPGWALQAGEPVDDFMDGQWSAAVVDVAAAIAAPLRSLDLDGQGLDLTDLSDYVQDVTLALQRALRQYVPADTEQEATDAE